MTPAMRPRDIGIVIAHEIRRLLRGPQGILFCVLFAGAFVPLAFWMRELAIKLGDFRGPASARGMEIVYEPLAWFTELDKETISGLVQDHPPALLLFFSSALFFTPFLAMMGSFDQTASDIRIRGLRYVLLRTDRTSLYIGKTLGALSVFAALSLLAVMLVGVLLAMTDGGLGGAGGVVYLARIWASVVVFAVPFVALMGLTNALTGHPYLALGLGFGIQFAVWLLATIGGNYVDALAHVQLIFPTAFKYHLVSDGMGDVVQALAQQAAFTAVVFTAGWLAFRRRDV